MPDLIELFHWFHSHPELGFEEKETTAQIRRVLAEAGVPTEDGGLATGLVATIRGHRPGKTVALRCDIDALPIQEETCLPYASQAAGRMHACGHDFHLVTMLGAALGLYAQREKLPGTVKVIFQPAEEIDAGAERLIAAGLVADADAFIGIHSYPGQGRGWLGVKEGSVMAAVDRFAVTIRGRGAHAAHPHKGIDPIAVQAAVIQAVQTIISRSFDPFAPGVVSITHVESGSTWNVIPETAFLEGTVRTLNPSDRALAEKRFRGLVTGIAASFGAQADIVWTAGSPAVINDAGLCALARRVAQERGFRVGLQEDTLGGEDFSCYLRDKPGIFIRVGTGGAYPAHHPRFTVDPSALEGAADYFTALALAYLTEASVGD